VERLPDPPPEATLEFRALETGTYYLWIRMMGPDSSSDALYVGIDDILEFSKNNFQ
jgi:hypothetical protein